MRIEIFNASVSSDGAKKETYSPDFKGVIVGIMVSQKHRENDDIKVSLQTTIASERLLDPIPASLLADRGVEWGRNYFPLNVPTTKIDVTTSYSGEGEFDGEIELLFIIKSEQECKGIY